MLTPKLRFPQYIDKWKSYTIKEVFDRVGKPVDVKEGQLYREIGIRSHGKGLFYKDETTMEELGNKRVFWIEPDCFIVNIVFAWERAVARTTQNEVGMIASHRFPMYKPKPEILDLDYITIFFTTKEGQKVLSLASPGGAGRNKTLGQKEFAESNIKLPSYNEQKKIASLIMTIDEIIEKSQEEVAAWEKRKKGVMQKIFSQEVRFKADDGTDFPDWEEKKLGDVVQITMGQSPDGNSYSKTPSEHILVQGNADLEHGWVKPRIWTTQVTKQASAGDLIMSVRAPAGAMGKTAYDIVIGRGVAAIKGNEFMYQLLVKMDKEGYWKKLSCGSTFESLNSNNIKNAEILLPHIDEQRKIADCLASLDEVITQAKSELEKWQELKKGLLQQLFV